MTRKDEAQILDQLENSLIRAEKGQKDIDLIVALRVLYQMVREQMKEEDRHGKT